MDKDCVKDRMLGCLYGQAVGDALGLGTEFLSKDEVLKHYPNGMSRYEDIIQDTHRSRWHKGAWTDDTDMMLCILSAFEKGAFNIRQVAKNFKDWHDGTPMGIGRHMSKVLLGAKYGYDAIPRYYIDNLYNETEYRHKVDDFIALAIDEKE